MSNVVRASSGGCVVPALAGPDRRYALGTLRGRPRCPAILTSTKITHLLSGMRLRLLKPQRFAHSVWAHRLIPPKCDYADRQLEQFELKISAAQNPINRPNIP